MYRRPKFLELLLKIREEMAREADYDVDFFVEMVRNRMQPATDARYSLADPDSVNRKQRTGQRKTRPSKKRTNQIGK